MIANSKHVLREWLPSGFVRLVGPYVGRRIRFYGEYAEWRSALEQTSGYDSQGVLERVRAAASRAARAEATFERDGTVLNDAEPPFPLLTALLRAANERGGSLSVLDFGGSLGSVYYQCRPFLMNLSGLRWIVVEQPQFVESGRKLFEDDVLKFAVTVDEAIQKSTPDVILFSAVLQYLEKPLDAVKWAVEIAPPTIVIDRTPLVPSLHESRIAVQKVPRRLGSASYPLWLFNRDQLVAPTLGRYRVLVEYDAVDGVMSYGFKRVEFKGFILDKLNGRVQL